MEDNFTVLKEYQIIIDLRKAFANAFDFICKELLNNIYIIYLKGFTDQNIVDNTIMKNIINNKEIIKKEKLNNKEALIGIQKFIDITGINDSTIKLVTDTNEIIEEVLKGNVIIVYNQYSYFSFNIKSISKRGIEESTIENVVKGSKESFIEDIQTNLVLLRRKLRTKNLKFVLIEVGNEAKTKILVSYVENIADEKTINQVISKIKAIETDNINCLATFEENFASNAYNIFPELLYTEKPEKTAASLMEGRIGIFLDGYPMAYIVPVSFPMFLQASEEYSDKYLPATFIRILRYFSFITSLILPAFYNAIVAFHQEMIPTRLAGSLIKSKQDVPIPAFLEVIVMLIAFEMLLEAGARLPKNIGQTISIVGGLIVGEAAVSAKFVSPAVVVIIAASGISGFLISNQSLANSVRILRLGLVILSTMAGLIGMVYGLIAIIYYMCSIKNLGENYMSPFAGDNKNKTADTITRLPLIGNNKKARW